MARPSGVPPKILLVPLRHLPPPEPTPQPAAVPGSPPHRTHNGSSPATSREAATWLRAVRSGAEASLLLDGQGGVAAISDAAASLLQLDQDSVGRRLVDLLGFADFSHAAADLSPSETLPMLTSTQTGQLARGLIRVRTPDGRLTIYDVISAPVLETGGSLSFLLPV